MVRAGSTLLERRGSLRYLAVGPSASLRKLILSDSVGPSSVDEELRDLKLVSLFLDEPLFEGGLEVARIKCSFDTWWVKEE